MRRRETGTVKWFSDQKGYGFIERDRAGDIFVHHTEVKQQGFESLHKGQRVEFTVEQGKKGPRAINVVPLWYTPSLRAAI